MTAQTASAIPVRKSITVNASVEHAFHVYTAGFDSWWPREHHIGKSPMKRAIIEGAAGGRCYSEQVDGTECDWGRILVWDPPHVLEHEWKQPIVEDGVVRYELTADGDGTLLRFTHRGLGVRNASGFLGGTHAFLDRLEAYLTGDELPNWAARRLEVNQRAQHLEAN